MNTKFFIQRFKGSLRFLIRLSITRVHKRGDKTLPRGQHLRVLAYVEISLTAPLIIYIPVY